MCGTLVPRPALTRAREIPCAATNRDAGLSSYMQVRPMLGQSPHSPPAQNACVTHVRTGTCAMGRVVPVHRPRRRNSACEHIAVLLGRVDLAARTEGAAVCVWCAAEYPAAYYGMTTPAGTPTMHEVYHKEGATPKGRTSPPQLLVSTPRCGLARSKCQPRADPCLLCDTWRWGWCRWGVVTCRSRLLKVSAPCRQ